MAWHAGQLSRHEGRRAKGGEGKKTRPSRAGRKARRVKGDVSFRLPLDFSRFFAPIGRPLAIAHNTTSQEWIIVVLQSPITSTTERQQEHWPHLLEGGTHDGAPNGLGREPRKSRAQWRGRRGKGSELSLGGLAEKGADTLESVEGGEVGHVWVRVGGRVRMGMGVEEGGGGEEVEVYARVVERSG